MRPRTLLLGAALLAAGARLLPVLLPRAAAAPERRPVLTYALRARLNPATREVLGSGTLTWRNLTGVPVPDFHLHLYLNAFRDEHSTFLKETLGAHRGATFDGEHPGGIELRSFRTADGTELKDRGAFVSCDDGNPDDRTVYVMPLPEAIPAGGEATFQVAFTSRLPKAFARTGFGGEYHMVAQWYPKPGVFEEVNEGGALAGRWNCHQFHGSSEFFADYGDYDVTLTVPAVYAGRVGATGVRVADSADVEEGTVTVRHEARDVHDFAWVCDTDFVVREHLFPGGDGGQPEEQARVAALLGRAPHDLDLHPVRVTLLLQPEHADQEERHRNAVFQALTHMGFWFGAYPYDVLTVVDPDHRAGDTGGMEYPTLITGGTSIRPAARGWDPEFVLVHEFGHQFFYGLVGTNEFEDAWMDEGLNTYATARVMTRAFRPQPPFASYLGQHVVGERPLPFPGLLAALGQAAPALRSLLEEDARIPFGRLAPVAAAGAALGLQPPDDLPLLPALPDASAVAWLREAPFLTLLPLRGLAPAEAERSWVASRPRVDPIAGVKAWEYMDTRSYGVSSYGRTAAALRTLEGLLGEETLLRGLRTYVERQRFRHPRPADLFATLDEVATAAGRTGTRDLLQVLFERAGTFDYGVQSIDADEAKEPSGPAPGAPPAPPHVPASRVTLRRHGDLVLPVDVLVTLEDGRERRLVWEADGRVTSRDGESPPAQPVAPAGTQGRWTRLVFVGAPLVASVEMDPWHRLALEHDRSNDGLVRKPKGPSPGLPLSIRLLGWVEQLTTFYGGL